MDLKFYLLVVFLLFEVTDCSECSSYTLLHSRDRAKGVPSGNAFKCDNYLSKGWYRFTGGAGYAMPTSCVPKNQCGTQAPGWMQGSHPTQGEGIVTRSVCYHWNNNCCNWRNNIRVRNCGGFYVYELVKPPTCNLRYCGNGGKDVTTTVTCGADYMQINLTKVHFPGVDWRNLHLKDKSCRATNTGNTMSVRTPINDCGTTYREHDKKIAFWNEVSNDGRGYGLGNQSTVTRGKNFIIPFYCEYGREKVVSTSFSPAKKIVYASEGSFGNFTFTMNLYQSSSYSTPYSPFNYPVVVAPNQPLWVQYQVKNTNADLVVFAENCRATPSNDPNASPQHVFLQRGCINDPTMVYSYDPSSHVQRFSVRSFRFVYSNSFYVYLHCELIACHRNTTNSRCARGCVSPRVRRETDEMDGSKAYDLSAGPFKKQRKVESEKQDREGSSKVNLPLVAGLATVGGAFLLITILLSVKMIRNRCVPANVTRPPGTTADVTVSSYEQQGVDQDEQVKTNA